MPFALGSFAGGVAQGLSQGQQFAANRQKLEDLARQRAAQEAVSNWLQQSGNADPDASATNQSMPTAVPLPGAQPVPGMGAPSPQPMAGPPGAMPAAPPQGQPPMPAPGGPAPGGPVPPPGGLAPTPQPSPQMPPQGGPAPGGGMPLSGAAQPTGNPWDDSKKTLQSVARSIAQANPGRKWKPGELLDAVNDVVSSMNGLNPEARIAAQAQIAGSKAQYEYWKAAMDDQRKGRGQDLSHEDRQARINESWDAVKLATGSREKIAAAADATRLQAASITQAGENARAGQLLDFKEQALAAGLDEKTWQTQMAAALKEQGMDDAFITKLFSTQGSAGQLPKTPPARTKVPLPGRGAGGGKAKPIPASTMAQWKQVPPANKAAAKKHLADQGYDVSGLN